MHPWLKPLLITLVLITMFASVQDSVAGEEEAPAPTGEGAAPKKAPAATEPKEEGGAKPKTSQDISGGRFTGDPVYVHLAPMIMPIISDEGVEQIVTFQIDIEVADFDQAEHIETIMPRVVDALMQALYGGLGQGSLRQGKLVNVAKIKTKAFNALTTLLGPNEVRDVLIQGVAQRMF